jgi:hypothetical protein
MNDYLTIVDLNYLESLEGTEIVGGYVSTKAYTSAGFGSAFAYGDAAAYGQQTYTNTDVVTSIKNYSSATQSYAKASATAYANNNGINEKSSYKSTSIYYSGY